MPILTMPPSKICFVTAGRMDFGLISSVMDEVKKNTAFSLYLVPLFAHNLKYFGDGGEDTENINNFKYEASVDTLHNDDSPRSIARSMAKITDKLGTILCELKPDLLVIPGDRYEMLSAASIATIMNIPTAHLYGGDLSYGAYDENIRHAITKLSHIHFTSNDAAKKRVLQMGENPQHVFNLGAPALSYLDNFKPVSKKSLEAALDISFGPRNILATYHPATRSNEDSAAFIAALKSLPEDIHVFLTLPNADHQAITLYEKIKNFTGNRSNCWAFKALGSERYLSIMSHVDLVLGNSSSGLYEAPSFGVPTVNVGERQRGRLAPDSVVHCPCETSEILKAIEKAFQKDCKSFKNPYYQPNTAKNIVIKLQELAPFHQLIGKEFQEYG